MNKILINLSRLLLAGIIIYELLNQFKILHQPLTFTWIGLAITAIFVWIILETASLYTRKKCGRPIPGLAMMAAVGVVYFDALGDIFHLYANYGWYDQLAHFLGGAAVGGIIFSIVRSLLDCQHIRLGAFGAGFFSWTTAAFFSVLYELEEYFEDYFAGRIAAGYTLRLGDGPDTANDLFLDLVGSLLIIVIASVIYYVYHRKHSAN